MNDVNVLNAAVAALLKSADLKFFVDAADSAHITVKFPDVTIRKGVIGGYELYWGKDVRVALNIITKEGHHGRQAD